MSTQARKIIVLGSINMDVVVTAPRHPVPGETMFGDDLAFIPGGKGSNQAVAAGRLGGDVQLIGKLGTDAFGTDLKAFLNDEPLDLTNLTQHPTAPTGTALITVSADGENTIIVVSGSNHQITAADLDGVQIGAGDVVVSQFEVPQPALKSLFQEAKAVGAATVLNPAPAGDFVDGLLPLVNYLVVNETELAILAGSDRVPSGDAALLAAARTARASEAQTVVMTLGGDGVLCLRGDETIRLPGHAVPVVDTTGAGDCFVGALAVGLSEGQSLADALAFANKAASISVQRRGAAVALPHRHELG
jgi:ribokinase